MNISDLKEFALALLGVVLLTFVVLLPVLIAMILFGDDGTVSLPRLGALTFW